MTSLDRLKERVRRHEGFRSKTYLDTVGVPTIGYGLNLRDSGIYDSEMMWLRRRIYNGEEPISREFAEYLMGNRLTSARQSAMRYVGYDVWRQLNLVRQEVLIEMAYQLGEASLATFVRLRAAIHAQNWQAAYDEMLDSKWATADSPSRAVELATIMRRGADVGVA